MIHYKLMGINRNNKSQGFTSKCQQLLWQHNVIYNDVASIWILDLMCPVYDVSIKLKS